MVLNKLLSRALFLLGSFLVTLPGNGQIAHGGTPYGGKVRPSSGEVPFIKMEPVDESKLLKNDSLRRANGEKVLRFAKNLSVDIDLHDEGVRSKSRDGKVIHRLGIHSPGARSLSFKFAPYGLVKGAQLFIYTPDQKRILGSFTVQNRSLENLLATVPISGDRAVIELIEPAGKGGMSELVIGRVSHGYRSVFDMGKESARDFGDAGDCNMNVNCPDGKDWRRQKRSVAMLIDNGSRLCSGALVNNTAEDGTPYFLTADHCLENSSGPPSTWTFVFNYESPACYDQNGSLDQSISGSTLRANHEDSDFCLVELVDTPPSGYEVYYAGWDRSGTAPDSSVSIHHPQGDIKKISFDDDQAASGQFGNSIPNGEWHIKEWDRNTTTEVASSGAPLFDMDGHIKGQLHGGSAQCGNSVDDFYGKFSVSWDYHAAQDSQLRHWLDPIDTNPSAWPGYDPRVGNYPHDAAITSFLSPEKDLCDSNGFKTRVEFQNRGSQPLDSLWFYLVLEGDTLEELHWQGSLGSGSYDTLSFSDHFSSENGTLHLLAGTRKPNGQSDPDPSDDTLSLPLNKPSDARRVRMELRADCYGSETSWYLEREESGDTLYSRSKGFYPGTATDPEDGGSEWTHSFCLQEGCYRLLLKDDYGDGMNGSQDGQCDVDGKVRIVNANGELLTRLGDPAFGTDTVLSFCTDSTVMSPPPGPEGVKVFPNPVQGAFRLQIKGEQGSYRIGLFDTRGRRILLEELELDKGYFNGKLDLPELRSGSIYLLRIKGPTGSHLKKLFIDR